ncbi:MAG TPA: ABC transporter ATP-binding protein [Caulobacteraceae bacterium]|nr:ABC transporter ATP-binding protein [Caulobacteraceae bacterium]
MTAPVLSVEDLTVEAVDRAGPRPLVQGLTLEIAPGEILGVVGESGSGKTVSAFAIAGLLPPALRIGAGAVRLEGARIDDLPEPRMRRIRGGRIGVVFQDPLSSFNPVRTIGSLLVESIRRHQGLSAKAARDLAVERLREMRLPGSDGSVDAYPHALSGGQRQRAMIALALANRPALLIADEPTTALDPTIQLQILALLKREVQDRACLLITHDLTVAAAVCDRIAVMYRGRVVETGPTAALLGDPQHDFTRRLLETAPSLRKGAA